MQNDKVKFLIITVLSIACFSCASTNIKSYSNANTLYSSPDDYVGEIGHITLRSAIAATDRPKTWKSALKVFNRVKKALKKLPGHKKSKYSYRLIIIDAQMINAFSMANGRIYVTTNLLQYIRSEDALAALFGHEMAHTELRHVDSAISRSQYNVFGFTKIVTHIFDQQAEYAADELGAKIAKKAGYKPAGAIDLFLFFNQLKRIYGIPGGGFLKTHPDSMSRAKTMADKLKLKATHDYTLNKSSYDFAQMKTELIDQTDRYYDTFQSKDHPARFKFKKKKHQREFSRIADKIRRHYDLAYGYKDLVRFQKRIKKTKKNQAVIHMWMARAKFYEGKPKSAMLHIKKAKSLWKGLESARWYGLLIKGYIEDSPQTDAWIKVSSSKKCRKSVECLNFALRFSGFMDVSKEDKSKVTKTYEKLVNRKFKGKPSKTAIQGLHAVVTEEIYKHIAEMKKHPEPITILPRGYKPSPYVKDLLLIEQRLIANYKQGLKDKHLDKDKKKQVWPFQPPVYF